MIFYSAYIYGANFIAKFWWEKGFLGGFHGSPLGTNGSESTLVLLIFFGICYSKNFEQMNVKTEGRYSKKYMYN